MSFRVCMQVSSRLGCAVLLYIEVQGSNGDLLINDRPGRRGGIGPSATSCLAKEQGKLQVDVPTAEPRGPCSCARSVSLLYSVMPCLSGRALDGVKYVQYIPQLRWRQAAGFTVWFRDDHSPCTGAPAYSPCKSQLLARPKMLLAAKILMQCTTVELTNE